jgi:membrane fusion protein (multidrug efflux system)
VYVEENQAVKAGEVVVELDPRDYQVALEQARAQLSQARQQTLSEQPNVPVTEVTNLTDVANARSTIAGGEAGVMAAERNYEAAVAKVSEAQANNAKAQADLARYRQLVDKEEVSREQFDQYRANAEALAATVAANQASAQAASRQVDQARQQLIQAQQRAEQVEKNAPRLVAIRQANTASRQSAAEAARAQLQQAELNLTYCKIVTPVSGIVAKRMAEVGQRLAPGEQVLLVTQIDDLWVTANFRETQLRLMHPGQSTRIHVDALGADFDGSVESMPAASGAVTSLLPPENATGNFVKIVQRLPVRIRFNKNQQGLERLRPGMSVEPKVTVR